MNDVGLYLQIYEGTDLSAAPIKVLDNSSPVQLSSNTNVATVVFTSEPTASSGKWSFTYTRGDNRIIFFAIFVDLSIQQPNSIVILLFSLLVFLYCWWYHQTVGQSQLRWQLSIGRSIHLHLHIPGTDRPKYQIYSWRCNEPGLGFSIADGIFVHVSWLITALYS